MPAWTKNQTNKFDLDLRVGEMFEDSLASILKLEKVEIKTEINKWRESGNIAIEIRCYGKLSGLSVTEADYWAHILSYKGDIKAVLLFPVEELRRIVRELTDSKEARIVMGGDDSASQMVLVPLEKLRSVL